MSEAVTTACIGLRAKTARAIVVVLAGTAASPHAVTRTEIALASAVNDLPSSVHSERGFEAAAAARLTLSIEEMRTVLADIGRMLGTPWRADEKAAAMAAWIGLANQLTAKQ